MLHPPHHYGLLELASKHDLVVSLRVRPGSHAIDGAALAVAWPPGRVGQDALAGIREAVRIDQARSPDQDVEFLALLLEEMGVRALSPGTNDPYTRSTPWITSPPAWVLGIDNAVFISILAAKLPAHQQARARRIGLLLALVTRIVLLFSLSWIIRLTAPLFTVLGQEISGRT